MNDSSKTNKDITLTLNHADRAALKAAIHTQLKSLERAARAQQTAGRQAMAEIYTSEAIALSAIGMKL